MVPSAERLTARKCALCRDAATPMNFPSHSTAYGWLMLAGIFVEHRVLVAAGAAG